MARSRRAKSQSVSSNTAENLINGEMPPPSPVTSRASPAASRRKASGATRAAASNALASAAQPKSAHAPAKPSRSQFVLATAISFAAEAVLNTVISAVIAGDLAAISRRNVDWPTISGLWIWKTLLLAVYWFSGFDAIDVASLTTLLITPTTTLYYFFYRISFFTLLSTTVSSIVASSLPFYLLRPLAPPHSQVARLRNRSIITDPLTTIATSLTATLLFAATLQLSFSTFLPVFLITRFSGLRDLTVAHSLAETLPLLLFTLLPAGLASTNFLFRPSEGAPTNPATGVNTVAVDLHKFDPATSTFLQHLYWNMWGWYTSRQKELIGRSLVLGVLVWAETVIQVAGTVEGVEWFGAVGYGAVWATAVGVVGFVLEWVGGPSD